MGAPLIWVFFYKYMQVSIYKIKEGVKLEEIKKYLISKGLDEQELKIEYKKNIFLFYENKTTNKKWKKFLEDLVCPEENILKPSGSEKFILLVKQNEFLYAILGGAGYFLIKDCIEKDFGFKIASQLIGSNKSENIIKYSKEKSVMSKIIGQVKYFRTRSNFIENNSFGNFYKELNISIKQDVLLEKFNFSPDEVNKESACLVKSSFQINKSISFNKTLEIISVLDEMLKKGAVNIINNVKIVEDKKTIKNLEDVLLSQLKDRCYKDDFIDFDLCHEDFEKYLTADEFIVKKQNKLLLRQGDLLDNIDIVFLKIKENFEEEEFEDIIKEIKIITNNVDGDELTKDSLIKHLHGDVEYKGDRYFYINGDWFLIEKSFIDFLNEGCINFSKENLNRELDRKWEEGFEEDDYNFSYIGDKNTLVLHKIIHKNIELCDILKWDDKGNVYMYYVKKGFGNSLRDLCSQILISAKTIKNDKNFIDDIFKSLKKSGNLKLKNQYKDYEKIVKNIKSSNIHFVLTFFDKAKTREETIYDNIEMFKKFQSNIAKFSIMELILSMKELEKFNLQITQIKK